MEDDDFENIVPQKTPSETLTELIGSKAHFSIRFRKDEVHCQINAKNSEAINGCLFIITNKNNQKNHLVWCPYSLLLTINERLITHVLSNSTIVTKNDLFPMNSKNDSKYVSAFVTTNPDTKKFSKPNPEELYAIETPLHEISNLKRSIPTMGYSHLVISVKGGVSYSPLYFHDGGIQDFFLALSSCMNVTKDKNENNTFKTDNSSEPLEKSLHHLKFDSYFDDVYKNRDISWQLLEWGAKVTQKAKNLFKNEKQEDELITEKQNENDDEFEIIGDFDVSEDLVTSTTVDEKEIDWKKTEQEPVNEETFKTYFDQEGRLTKIEEFKKDVFYGGIEESVRKEAWKYLLGYYPFNSTTEERKEIYEKKKKEYEVIKTQWESITPFQESKNSMYRDLKCRIEKDVVRTDRSHEFYKDEESPYLKKLQNILLTYGFYNFDLGYCFLGGTKVYMGDGSLKNIEEIKVGEYVLGMDSKPILVIDTISGYDNFYRIIERRKNQNTPIIHNRIEYICNSKHLLYVFTPPNASISTNHKNYINIQYNQLTDWKLSETNSIKLVRRVDKKFYYSNYENNEIKNIIDEFLSTLKLIEWSIEAKNVKYLQGKVRSATYQKWAPIKLQNKNFETLCNNLEIKSEHVTKMAWLFGLWIGDGESKKTRISVNIKDKDEIEYIKEISEDLGLQCSDVYQSKLQIESKSLTGTVSLSKKINSKNSLWEIIKFFGMGMKDSKTLPLLFTSEEYKIREFLLSGLIDSDGYVRTRKNFDKEYIETSITTIYPDLRDGIVSLSRSLGIDVYVTKRDEYIDKNGTNHLISYSIYLMESPEVLNILSKCIISRKFRKSEVEQVKRLPKEFYFDTEDYVVKTEKSSKLEETQNLTDDQLCEIMKDNNNFNLSFSEIAKTYKHDRKSVSRYLDRITKTSKVRNSILDLIETNKNNIKSIKKERITQRYYGITLSNQSDRLFLLSNNAIVHNCQGMGDLISPILVIMEDEVISFWCFEHLMKTKEQNFFINSEGMENQLNQLRGLLKILDRDFYFYLESKDATNLYFSFRWLLVIFKREFEFEEIKRLWESLFTDYMGTNFHLFVAYSILSIHRDAIMKEEMSFDEILKFCIDLSGNLDLDQIMFQAEKSYLHYQAIEKEIKK